VSTSLRSTLGYESTQAGGAGCYMAVTGLAVRWVHMRLCERWMVNPAPFRDTGRDDGDEKAELHVRRRYVSIKERTL
jgi:hypothetical protein